MDDENVNYEVIYYPEGDEYRIYCDVCDNLCIERFYKNHFKSQTQINNFRKTEDLDKSFQVTSII